MTATHKALVTAPFHGPALERLRAIAEVVVEPWLDQDPFRLLSPEDLAARVSADGFDILVCEADSCSGPVLDQDLLVIASTRGNPTNVDLPGATAAGIPVLHTPGRNADAVAELTIGLFFALTRGILPADRDQRSGQVFKDGTIPYQRFRAWELKGRTLGIVGFGAIGRQVAWRAEGLGMTVMAHDPYVDDAEHDLDDLLAAAHIVTVHAPVTPATTGMIGRDQFQAMAPGTFFVNSARAELHDMDALVDALRSGHLAGAALDHFPGEHLALDHPLVAMENVILTPHIGGATYDTEANHSTMIVEDIERIIAGERPVRLANPEVYAATDQGATSR